MIGRLIALAFLAAVGLPLFADSSAGPSAIPGTTALTKYRCYTHDVVTPLWYREMNRNNFGALRYGEVKIHCRVHADGTVSEVTVVLGDSTGLLKTVSLNVLQSATPFKPFDSDLIREMGTSYVDDFDFKVVRKSAMSPAALRQENRRTAPASVD